MPLHDRILDAFTPRSTRTRRRRMAAAALTVSLALAAALASAPSLAGAVDVYGPVRPISGPGGCLSAPGAQEGQVQPCVGSAEGLAGAQAVAVSHDGGNVYVAGEEGVVALTRNRRSSALRPAARPSTRACLTADPASPCATKDPALSGADALAVSSDSRFVYVGASNTASVSAFARGPGGVLVPLAQHLGGGYAGCVAGEPLPEAPHPHCRAHMVALRGVAALALSPDGRYLYAVSYGLAPGEDSIVALQRDPATGGLRPLPGTGGCVQSLPGHGCRAVAGLEGADAIVISPNGRFVYVASAVSGAVRAFLRNRVTGALTPLYGPGGCVSSGEHADDDVPCQPYVPQLAGARSLALSGDGRELYVAAFDPGAVVVLARNRKSGRLQPQPSGCLQALGDASCPTGVAMLRGASALAVAPDGDYVYVACEGADSLVALARSPTDGTLSLPPTAPIDEAAPGGPAALAVSPGGGSLYVASPFDSAVAAFAG